MDINSPQDNNKIKYFLLKFMQFIYSAVNQNAGQYDRCMKQLMTINKMFIPKSAIFTCRLWSRSKFSGFKSRCTIMCRWQ